MNFFMSRISSSEEVCIIPLYVLNSVCDMNCFRKEAVIWPHLYGTIGSQSPWHCSNGVFLLPLASAGNFWCIGSQADKTNTPAKGSGNVRALYMARAPPWLKPPRTIRFVDIPAATSSAIKECTISAALRMPSSSSGPLGSIDLKSNQEGILNPAFSVTGIVGAVGQITLICGARTSPIKLAQPCPVSPNPWKNISVAVCLAVAAITTGLTVVIIRRFVWRAARKRIRSYNNSVKIVNTEWRRGFFLTPLKIPHSEQMESRRESCACFTKHFQTQTEVVAAQTCVITHSRHVN